MRQRFEQQMRIGATAIGEVTFPLKSRDELPPVLKELPYIFIRREFNEKVFLLREGTICKNKKKTDRRGLVFFGLLLITTDPHLIMVDYKIMEKKKDAT